jgi:hypothetical protein
MDRWICIMYSTALFTQSEHELISFDAKFATAASSKSEKINLSFSQDFPIGVLCHELHIETFEDKGKGRSINIVCINGVCAEVNYFPLPSYPCVLFVLHHVERLLAWHC